MPSLDRDADDLASFGYRQRLNRRLGAFQAFAVSYGCVAIFAGATGLFYFGYSSGGPAFIWGYPIVGALTVLIGLCLAEAAGRVPLTGSLYQWSRHISPNRFVPWLAGWLFVATLMIVPSVLGPTLQQLLTTVSDAFQLVGGAADVGTATTKDGAINAVILGSIALTAITCVNVIGVKWTGRVTELAVIIELVAVVVVIIGLATQARRGPGVVFETNGTGDAYSSGYFGAMLVALLSAAYVFYAFESAATLAEETTDPRRHGPRAMLRALLLSIAVVTLLVLVALMATKNLHAEELSLTGMPYIVKSTLGAVLGDALLISVAIAVMGAIVAAQATAVRVIFSMARDNQLPFSKQLSQVSDRWKTPVLPTVMVAVVAIGLLFLNYGNPRIFSTITGVVIVLYYVCYLLVVGPMLFARLRGEWPGSDDGAGFSLGRWGLPVNIGAVLAAIAIIVDIAWPRAQVYGNDHWYLQWGAFTFGGLLLLVGTGYYLIVQRHRAPRPLADHAAPVAMIDETPAPATGP
ncbi:MAG: amino acid permease [Actinobacteria bacterium]|nr:amino acid permease [Actinomycetota bacterium]